jgi:hypothetical protein
VPDLSLCRHGRGSRYQQTPRKLSLLLYLRDSFAQPDAKLISVALTWKLACSRRTQDLQRRRTSQCDQTIKGLLPDDFDDERPDLKVSLRLEGRHQLGQNIVAQLQQTEERIYMTVAEGRLRLSGFGVTCCFVGRDHRIHVLHGNRTKENSVSEDQCPTKATATTPSDLPLSPGGDLVSALVPPSP